MSKSHNQSTLLSLCLAGIFLFAVTYGLTAQTLEALPVQATQSQTSGGGARSKASSDSKTSGDTKPDDSQAGGNEKSGGDSQSDSDSAPPATVHGKKLVLTDGSFQMVREYERQG